MTLQSPGVGAQVRTLVVDDDFRVARIHATSVDRVHGFSCVGQAHTAGQARELIEELQPDLMLLDIHLPDEDGLSLLRSLTAQGIAPSCILITASRDLRSVRTAMGLGVIHYLVKPFGFSQLEEKLLSYLQWRTQLSMSTDEETDQAGVDNLYRLLHVGTTSPTPVVDTEALSPTLSKVLQSVRESANPIGASAIAIALGISRPTAHRCLTELQRLNLLEVSLSYGATGRPRNLYGPA